MSLKASQCCCAEEAVAVVDGCEIGGEDQGHDGLWRSGLRLKGMRLKGLG